MSPRAQGRILVSYSLSYADTARALCDRLESRGIPCWMAPRDLSPGEEYAEQITAAIDSCSAVLAVVSEESNRSRGMQRELSQATAKGKVLIPLFLQNFRLDPSLEYFLASTNRLMALDGIEPHVDKLVSLLRQIAPGLAGDPEPAKPRPGLFSRFLRARAPTAPVSRPAPRPPPPRPEAVPIAAYDVFVSANSADYPQAQVAYEALLQAGLRVFFAKVELPEMGDSDYRKAISRALEGSHHLLVVTTSRGHVESQWVEYEWGTFLNEKRSGRKTGNLAILLCGTMRIDELPIDLRQYQAVTPSDMSSLLKYFKPRSA